MIRTDNSGTGIAGLGRGEDSMLAHVAPGEMVVPPVISPQTQGIIEQEMMSAGLDPNEYTVGQGMSINPITGMAEFSFLKKLGKSLKKVVKKVAPVAMLIPGVGTAIGGALGGLGSAIGLGGKLPKLTSFFQNVASKNIPGISPFLSGLTAGATGSTFATASNPFGQAITTGLTNPFGGAFSSATGGVNPLTGATGGLTSTFTKAFGGGTNTGGGGVSLPLMALAGLYGKAVKEDYEKKEGGLKDIRQSVRPDLMPQQTFQGFDLGIRKAAMGGLQELRPGYANGTPRGLMANELDLRPGGPSIGPGTGTSDDIPAMLSDGEFVMTSAANNGLGGFKVTKTETGIELIPNGKPDRQKGAKNMDKLMKTFEQFNKVGQA